MYALIVLFLLFIYGFFVLLYAIVHVQRIMLQLLSEVCDMYIDY